MTHNIEDQTGGRFAEIIRFVAESDDQRIKDTFLKCLYSMALHATHENQKVQLFSDFAKLSMAFTVFDTKELRPVFNGGIIYHPKPGEPAEDNFSVHLDSSFYGFSVHT